MSFTFTYHIICKCPSPSLITPTVCHKYTPLYNYKCPSPSLITSSASVLHLLLSHPQSVTSVLHPILSLLLQASFILFYNFHCKCHLPIFSYRSHFTRPLHVWSELTELSYYLCFDNVLCPYTGVCCLSLLCVLLYHILYLIWVFGFIVHLFGTAVQDAMISVAWQVVV